MARNHDSDEAQDSFRRAALFLGTAVREGRFSAVLFTSARPGEGTTTAVLRVAEVLLREFRLRTLIVELDRRRPTLARRLGLDASRSIEAVAAGRASPEQCVQRAASGVAVLPAAGDETAPFDVAAALRRVLDKAAGEFDVALIDAPAVLDRADAVGAAAVVPDVVFVVEAGHTPRAAIERARTELARESARVVGSILTKHKRFIPQWLYDLLARS